MRSVSGLRGEAQMDAEWTAMGHEHVQYLANHETDYGRSSMKRVTSLGSR